MAAETIALTCPQPDVRPWKWTTKVSIPGLGEYDACEFPSPVPRWQRVQFIRGFPEQYVDAFLVAAQDSDTLHAWRVDEQVASADVSPELLSQARQLFERDTQVYDTYYMTCTGVTADGQIEPIVLTSARKRISPVYDSQGWIVVSRLLVLPQYRGQGIVSKLRLQFFVYSQWMCEFPAIGNMMPIETPQTMHVVQRTVASKALDLVPVGAKRWTLIDKELTCPVYLAFYPGMRKWLLARTADARARASLSPALTGLLDGVENVWREGYEPADGAALSVLYADAKQDLQTACAAVNDMTLYWEFLETLAQMGLLE